MSRYRKLSHTIYECKYHLVFCPKYRYRILKDEVAEYCRQQIYHLVKWKEHLEILELNILADHIHMVISIAPKYSVSGVLGYIKGKLAIRLFVKYESIGKRYWGRHLWSRGYCVSTVGLNEDEIRKYVRWQEKKYKDAERQGILEI
jgi:putative transposase